MASGMSPFRRVLFVDCNSHTCWHAQSWSPLRYTSGPSFRFCLFVFCIYCLLQPQFPRSWLHASTVCCFSFSVRSIPKCTYTFCYFSSMNFLRVPKVDPLDSTVLHHLFLFSGVFNRMCCLHFRGFQNRHLLLLVV